jgi:hypothetical protein
VTDGDDEVGADEQVQLPELDLLGLVEVPRRAQVDEEDVAVAFELRALMSLQGVLDGQRVQ